MTDIVARYTLAFQDLASRGILNTAGTATKLSRGLEKATKRAAALGSAVVAAATVVNQNTAEQANLAASVGKTVSELQGITGVAKSIGLEFDNVVDLQEEVINKFGEMAAAGEIPTTAIEGLRGLGFAVEQFLGVAERADLNELVDQALQSVANGSRTVADVQSALDQIAGGEANKILGAALSRNAKSVADLNAHYAKLNFLTKEGQAGAMIYTQRFSDLKFTLSSLSREGFGQLGAAMVPVIDNFNAFLVANKDIINAGMGDTISGIGSSLASVDWAQTATSARALAQGVGDVVANISGLVAMAGGIENIAIGLGAIWAADKIARLGSLVARVAGLAAILGGPVTIGLALAGVAAAGLWSNWDTLKSQAADLRADLDETFQKIAEINHLQEFGDGAKKDFAALHGEAKALTDEMSNTLAEIAEIDHFEELKNGAKGAFGEMRGDAEKLATDLAETFAQIFSGDDAPFTMRGGVVNRPAVTTATSNSGGVTTRHANEFEGVVNGTTGAVHPTSPLALDRELSRASTVIQRIEVESKVEVEVEGHIDGASITRTQANTVNRDKSGSNMPLRSRAGRTTHR